MPVALLIRRRLRIKFFVGVVQNLNCARWFLSCVCFFFLLMDRGTGYSMTDLVYICPKLLRMYATGSTRHNLVPALLEQPSLSPLAWLYAKVDPRS